MVLLYQGQLRPAAYMKTALSAGIVILLVRSRSHAWDNELLADTSNVRVCYSGRQATTA